LYVTFTTCVTFTTFVCTIQSPEGKRLLLQKNGKIGKQTVKKLYEESDRFPNRLIEQYLELLDRFELASSTNKGKMLVYSLAYCSQINHLTNHYILVLQWSFS